MFTMTISAAHDSKVVGVTKFKSKNRVIYYCSYRVYIQGRFQNVLHKKYQNPDKASSDGLGNSLIGILDKKLQIKVI